MKLSALTHWFYRTPFALKFAVVGLAVAGPLLVVSGIALGAFHTQVRSMQAVESALVKADLIRTLTISIARHRGLSATVLAGGEDVSRLLVDEQNHMLPLLDRVLDELNGKTLQAIGLPDPEGLRLELQALAQLPTDERPAENFERHNAVIAALLGASARLGQGLALDPEHATENDAVFVRLPLLIEELGRLRGWGSAILTTQQASPQALQSYLVYAGAVTRRLELLRADPATLSRLDQLHGGLGQPMRDALREAEGFMQRSLQAVQEPPDDDDAGKRHFADGTAVIELLANVNETLGAARRGSTELALGQAKRARNLTLLGLLCTLGILLVLYREFARTTVQRLQALKQATGRLASSDFEQPIAVEGLDEIAQLGQALDAARAQLREALAEKARGLAAQQADQAKTAFMARWSHDLRTPLNAVLGFADLIESRAENKLSEAQRQDLQRIRQAGRHLLRLVNDVLDITRMEASRIELNLAACELHEAAREIIELLQPQAEHAAVALRLVAAQPPARALVLADHTRLLQVLGHLVVNAIRYNRPGGRVEILLRHRGSEYGLEVSDTGSGLAPERVANLFDAFRTGSSGSSGLGLPLSQKLAQRMGGRIEVHSEPGQGSRFTLWLPQAKAIEPRSVSETAQHAAMPAVAGSIAYVEDEPVNALLVREMLAGVPGLSLQVFDRTEAARAAVKAGAAFDLWLLDKQLPDGDGVSLYLELKTLAAERGLPPPHAVMLSADALPESVSKALAAGFADYWTKPVALAALRSGVVRELLRSAAATGQRSPPGGQEAGLATIGGSGEPSS